MYFRNEFYFILLLFLTKMQRTMIIAIMAYGINIMVSIPYLYGEESMIFWIPNFASPPTQAQIDCM